MRVFALRDVANFLALLRLCLVVAILSFAARAQLDPNAIMTVTSQPLTWRASVNLTEYDVRASPVVIPTLTTAGVPQGNRTSIVTVLADGRVVAYAVDRSVGVGAVDPVTGYGAASIVTFNGQPFLEISAPPANGTAAPMAQPVGAFSFVSQQVFVVVAANRVVFFNIDLGKSQFTGVVPRDLDGTATTAARLSADSDVLVVFTKTASATTRRALIYDMSQWGTSTPAPAVAVPLPGVSTSGVCGRGLCLVWNATLRGLSAFDQRSTSQLSLASYIPAGTSADAVTIQIETSDDVALVMTLTSVVVVRFSWSTTNALALSVQSVVTSLPSGAGFVTAARFVAPATAFVAFGSQSNGAIVTSYDVQGPVAARACNASTSAVVSLPLPVVGLTLVPLANSTSVIVASQRGNAATSAAVLRLGAMATAPVLCPIGVAWMSPEARFSVGTIQSAPSVVSLPAGVVPSSSNTRFVVVPHAPELNPVTFSYYDVATGRVAVRVSTSLDEAAAVAAGQVLAPPTLIPGRFVDDAIVAVVPFAQQNTTTGLQAIWMTRAATASVTLASPALKAQVVQSLTDPSTGHMFALWIAADASRSYVTLPGVARPVEIMPSLTSGYGMSLMANGRILLVWGSHSALTFSDSYGFYVASLNVSNGATFFQQYTSGSAPITPPVFFIGGDWLVVGATSNVAPIAILLTKNTYTTLSPWPSQAQPAALTPDGHLIVTDFQNISSYQLSTGNLTGTARVPGTFVSFSVAVLGSVSPTTVAFCSGVSLFTWQITASVVGRGVRCACRGDVLVSRGLVYVPISVPAGIDALQDAYFVGRVNFTAAEPFLAHIAASPTLFSSSTTALAADPRLFLSEDEQIAVLAVQFARNKFLTAGVDLITGATLWSFVDGAHGGSTSSILLPSSSRFETPGARNLFFTSALTVDPVTVAVDIFTGATAWSLPVPIQLSISSGSYMTVMMQSASGSGGPTVVVQLGTVAVAFAPSGLESVAPPVGFRSSALPVFPDGHGPTTPPTSTPSYAPMPTPPIAGIGAGGSGMSPGKIAGIAIGSAAAAAVVAGFAAVGLRLLNGRRGGGSYVEMQGDSTTRAANQV